MTDQQKVQDAIGYIEEVIAQGNTSPSWVLEEMKLLLADSIAEKNAWRECKSYLVRELAAIVTVRTPDNLCDLNAIPRDPVMLSIGNIKRALDAFENKAALAHASSASAEECSMVAKDAERYRWLRDLAGNEILDRLKELFDTSEFDKAIDQAIAGRRGDGNG